MLSGCSLDPEAADTTTSAADTTTSVEELTGGECPRLTDMVTNLEDAETVASENPDHPWTPDLEAIIGAEHEAFAGLATDAGCDA